MMGGFDRLECIVNPIQSKHLNDSFTAVLLIEVSAQRKV